MKRQGDISTVEEIEELIKQTEYYRLVKDGSRGNRSVPGSDFASAVFTKTYEVYNGEFVFIIKLEFDYRIGRGRMGWQHKENSLFQAIPGLRPKLLALYPMSNGWRKEIPFRQHMENGKPNIPYDVKRLTAIADSREDEWAQQRALEELASIRDFIDNTLQSKAKETSGEKVA